MPGTIGDADRRIHLAPDPQHLRLRNFFAVAEEPASKGTGKGLLWCRKRARIMALPRPKRPKNDENIINITLKIEVERSGLRFGMLPCPKATPMMSSWRTPAHIHP